MSREFIEEYLNSFAEFVETYWQPYSNNYYAHLEYQKFEYTLEINQVEDRFVLDFYSGFKFKLKDEVSTEEYKMPYLRQRFEFKNKDDAGKGYNQIFKNFQRNLVFAVGDLKMSNILKGEANLNGLVFQVEREDAEKAVILKDIVDEYLAKNKSYGEEKE